MYKRQKGEYATWFAEVGVGQPRLTEAMKKALGASKVAKWMSMTTSNEWTDMRTRAGWDKAKIQAKSRSVLYTHFSPPWDATRQVRIQEGQLGVDHGRVKTLLRSERFVEEMKLVNRALALCLIKHAIGDFFSIELTWPNPAQELEAYKELASCPGVYQVTTDDERGLVCPAHAG